MPKKRTKNKRKGKAEELSDMGRLLLFGSVFRHLNNGDPLSAHDRTLLESLRKSTEAYCEEYSKKMEANNQIRLQKFVDDASVLYRENRSDYNRERLERVLVMAGMDPEEYIQENFKSNIVEFAAKKRCSNAIK